MDVETFRKLISPAGDEILQAAMDLAPDEAGFLRHFTALSKAYPPELSRAALEIAILRREGGGKFPLAERMFFTRPALEQATSFPVSSYRAKRFSGCERLLDLGCSIGGDTLALAAQAPTLGADLDGLRLAMAQANLSALGFGNQTAFIQADLTARLPFASSSGTGVFFDPARRDGQRRAFSTRDYHPPLSIVAAWLPHFPALCVKISPGVDLEELGTYDAEIEFISWQGNLKEAVLWFGPLKSASRRATLLPGAHTLIAPGRLEESQGLPLDAPRAFLYEPDPSILRAGLVQTLGRQLNAAQLDPDIAYLTSDQLIPTPFARAWAVETWLPFGVKKLRAALRQRGVSQVVVKKRGSPLQPEELIHALHLKEDGLSSQAERVLFLTHLRGRPIVVICFPPQ